MAISSMLSNDNKAFRLLFLETILFLETLGLYFQP